MLTFPRGEARQAILQRLLFRDRSTQFLELFKKLVGIGNTERLWNGTTIKYIKRSFTGVAITVNNAPKFCVADFCRAAKGAGKVGAPHSRRGHHGSRKSRTPRRPLRSGG